MYIIKLPAFFSLRGVNLKESVNAINKLIYYKNKTLSLDFSEIKEMSKGELLVLYAQLEKSILTNQNKIYRIGKLPSEKNVKSLLKTSEKIFHINKQISISEISEPDKEKLLNPNLIDLIVKDLKKIGIKEYFTPFYEFLTELIGNAVEHGIENKNINWWLTQEIDTKKRTIKFSFVDMGSGIINTHKKAGLPFKYYFLNDSKIVLDAFKGTLGSSTKQSNRGKGLPQLMSMIENEYISNLVLITNNVYLRYENGVFVEASNPNFIGTYFSWSIDQNNYLKWKKLK